MKVDWLMMWHRVTVRWWRSKIYNWPLYRVNRVWTAAELLALDLTFRGRWRMWRYHRATGRWPWERADVSR